MSWAIADRAGSTTMAITKTPRRAVALGGRTVSMRRSGISQISATATKIAWAIHGATRVARIARTYKTGDSLPFQSRPTAFFKIDSGPWV